MIMDDYLEFADAVSVAAAAGTALIGDVVDLGVVPRDIGNGEDTYLVISVATAIIAASAGTVRFLLVSDAQTAIAVDGSATVHYDSGTFASNVLASTEMPAGRTLVTVALPREGKVYERYLGVLCIIASQTITAGAIDAFITKDPRGFKAYSRASQ
jgi:hypothetical protein